MKLTLPKFTWPTWSRNTNGDNFYDLTSTGDWMNECSNLYLAENHPILTPAILFVAKIFSQAELTAYNAKGEVKQRDDSLTKLLKNPNPYQTQQDFLETLMFMMIAQGVAIVAKEKILGFDDPKSFYVLNKDLIEWPDNFDNIKFRKKISKSLSGYIIYDKDGENIKYKIEDLMFFYDLPNGIHRNPFEVKSRIDGLKQTLVNTMDSLIAKNIILKSNGKEIIGAKKEGFPLEDKEKKRIQELFNSKFGLAHNRKRGIVTRAELTWKSLHIALRDLGLDESTKVDGNIIYTALHIPKDILSLEAKKTTYNNFKESMVSYIQNEMQSTLNSAVAVFNKHFPNHTLKGSFEKLPIMQFILLERYEMINKRAQALRSLLSVGIPQEIALEMCGFDKSLELGEMLQEPQNNNSNSNSNSNGEEEKDWTPLKRIG